LDTKGRRKVLFERGICDSHRVEGGLKSGTVYLIGEERSVLGAFPGPHGFIAGKELTKKLR